MKLKYILGENGNFAIFNPVNSHQDMARAFYGKVTSAGFCYIDTCDDKQNTIAQCFGQSTSLDLKSKEEDSETITKLINREEW